MIDFNQQRKLSCNYGKTIKSLSGFTPYWSCHFLRYSRTCRAALAKLSLLSAAGAKKREPVEPVRLQGEIRAYCLCKFTHTAHSCLPAPDDRVLIA